MGKVIVIIRSSTIKQEIESQKKELIEWTKCDGYSVSDMIVIGEAGASAIKLDERYTKNMDQVKQLITNGGIEGVYAWSIDRIGRNDEFLIGFKNFLVANKVQLKVKNPSLVLLNADGSINSGVEVAFSLFATMAKQEMEQKKARFKRAKARNGEEGKWNGGSEIRFGYKVDSNNFIIPNEEEAKVVREIFKLYASGKYSMQKLATELNNRGWKHRDKKYTLDFIARLLADTIYIGYKDNNKYAKKYTPIIDSDVWDKVVKIRGKQTVYATTTKETKNIHYATKILKCKSCGNNYYADFDKYSCYKKRFPNRFEDKCSADPLTIKIEIMDMILWDLAKVLHSEYLSKVDDVKLEELEEQKVVLVQKMETTQNRLNNCTNSINNLKKRILDFDSIFNADEIKEAQAKILYKQTTLLAEMERYNEELEELEQLIYDVQNPNPLRILSIVDSVDGTVDRSKCKEIINQHIKEAYLNKIDFNNRKCTVIIVVDKKDNKYKFIYDPIAKKLNTQNKNKNLPYLYWYNEGKIEHYHLLQSRYDAIKDFRSCVSVEEVEKLMEKKKGNAE